MRLQFNPTGLVAAGQSAATREALEADAGRFGRPAGRPSWPLGNSLALEGQVGSASARGAPAAPREWPRRELELRKRNNDNNNNNHFAAAAAGPALVD